MSEDYKRESAKAALNEIDSNMILGLGTGSTANHFVRELSQKVEEGLIVKCVPTSEQTAELANSLNIPLVSFDEFPQLDLTIDGADELNNELVLIKGGGGALLREKIVAKASKRMVVIADTSKHVKKLGRFPLPIEVVQFGLSSTMQAIEGLMKDLGFSGILNTRKNSSGKLFVTDCGNHIIDASLGEIDKPIELEEKLKRIPGVVECGLFVGVATVAYVSGPSGVAKISAG